MQLKSSNIHENLGVTRVYVTHDQSEALTVRLTRGGVRQRVKIQHDPAETLHEAPVTSFIAGFIGESKLLPAPPSSMICPGVRLAAAVSPACAVVPGRPADHAVHPP